MNLADLISHEDVLASSRSQNKRALLQEISEQAAKRSGVEARVIFDALLQRERLGSTGAGNGVAIPHAKLTGIKRLTGLFARLERPIDFGAHDEQPVDLVFLLLAPESAGADHLKALARIARVAREPDLVAKLRETRDPYAIHTLLLDPPASNAA
jgi:PTS system nitrogen regulatory IIA component